MNNFMYVPKREYQQVKINLIKLINLVQNDVRNHFTFQYKFIGSSSRNMITIDEKCNTGYDFDVNLFINDYNNDYTPEELKTILINGFNKHKKLFSYDKIEDSKRVITIKVIDHNHSKILHSCDFAIVNEYTDDNGYKSQEYIHYNKRQGTYEWQEQSKGFYTLPNKADQLKKAGLWQLVRDTYIDKKNHNSNPYKKSRSLYAETINEVYKARICPKFIQ